MHPSPDTERVISITSAIVEQVSPDELFLFPAISNAYRQNPTRFLKRVTAKDKPLSFGPNEVKDFIAPTVLLIVEQAMIALFADTAKDGAKGLFHRLRKKTARHTPDQKNSQPPDAPTYTLDEIRAMALQTLLAYNIKEPKAQLISVALAGNLATMQKETDKTNG
jgi:hypothetical protein